MNPAVPPNLNRLDALQHQVTLLDHQFKDLKATQIDYKLVIRVKVQNCAPKFEVSKNPNETFGMLLDRMKATVPQARQCDTILADDEVTEYENSDLLCDLLESKSMVYLTRK